MTEYDCVGNIEDRDFCDGNCETCMFGIVVEEPEDWEA